MAMDGNCTDNGAIKQSTIVSFAMIACRKEERNVFILLRVFLKKYSLLLLLPKLLKGLFTT
jgi:hypothetical protein